MKGFVADSTRGDDSAGDETRCYCHSGRGMTVVLSELRKHRDKYGKLVMGTIFSRALAGHKTQTSLLWWKRL